MTARVLVVVPMYNAGATIAGTLDSVCAQCEHSWRCVVVDDGSTDQGPEIVRAYRSREPRIGIIRQPNRGLGAARNAGVRQREGEPFVLFLDADDTIMPDALNTLLAAHDDRDTPADIVCAGAEIRDDSGRTIGVRRPDTHELGLRDMLQMSLVLTHAQLFSAALFDRFAYDESRRLAEDYELYLEMALAGVRWICVDSVTAVYHVHAGGMSRDHRGMLDASLRLLDNAAERAGPVWTEADHAHARLALACAYGARIALSEDPASASLVITDACGPDALRGVHASLLARCCADACVFGAGVTPEHPAARGALEAWVRSIADQRDDASFVSRVMDGMSRAHRDPNERVQRLIGACGDAESVQLVGLGKNGRRVLEAALGAGLRVRVRDDRIDAGALDAPRDNRITIEHMDDPLDPALPLIISPSEHEALLERLHLDGIAVLTWNDQPMRSRPCM
ncbi:MAG: hypothetical protein Tsb0013_22040 [Phycisphaerales bacterium]